MAHTKAYQLLLRGAREATPTWGGARRHVGPVVAELRRIGLQRATILDYGCGAGGFAAEMKRMHPYDFTVSEYDPGVADKSALPVAAWDAVVCTHVLEHVEPAYLLDTLHEIGLRAKRLVYVEVPPGPAGKTLADGRNAHLIQEPPEWWRDVLGRSLSEWGFDIVAQRPGVNPINTIFVLECPARE